MPKNRPHGNRLRKYRYSGYGNFYLVTTCCRARKPVFADPDLGAIVAEEIALSDDANRTTTYAYTVMPDHLHWLFQLRSGYSLAAVVKKVKGRSAYRINKARGFREPLWQPGFHEHTIRNDNSLVDAGNYVIANPVRAGLVLRVEYWPVWGLMLDRCRRDDRG